MLFLYATQAEGTYAQYVALQYNSYVQACAFRHGIKPKRFAAWRKESQA